MPDHQGMDELRKQLTNAQSMYDRAMAFLELEWRDLLYCLQYEGFIATQAAICLHKKLDLYSESRSVIQDGRFWEQELNTRRIDPTTCCGACFTAEHYGTDG